MGRGGLQVRDVDGMNASRRTPARPAPADGPRQGKTVFIARPQKEHIGRDEFVAALSEMASSVYDFHQRFDVPRIGRLTAEEGPSADGLAALRSRLAFLIEETGEHAKELNRGELGDASKEIADVAFVAMGTLLVLDEIGVDACRAVAGKNNAKTAETHTVDATSGKLVRRVSAS